MQPKQLADHFFSRCEACGRVRTNVRFLWWPVDCLGVANTLAAVPPVPEVLPPVDTGPCPGGRAPGGRATGMRLLNDICFLAMHDSLKSSQDIAVANFSSYAKRSSDDKRSDSGTKWFLIESSSQLSPSTRAFSKQKEERVFLLVRVWHESLDALSGQNRRTNLWRTSQSSWRRSDFPRRRCGNTQRSYTQCFRPKRAALGCRVTR